MRRITYTEALAAFDVLVKHAGAYDGPENREEFARHVSRVSSPCEEYRFSGRLGFGGEFRNDANRDVPYVDCHAEDRTPERDRIVEVTNMALVTLFSRPRFVIINDTDAPEPRNVCQWVPARGYCYLDRSRGKPEFDGMKGGSATAIEAFGFTWSEGAGRVRFCRDGATRTAAYQDGQPRDWQSEFEMFDFPLLEQGARGARRVTAGRLIVWDKRRAS